jgi:hypothetical protein
MPSTRRHSSVVDGRLPFASPSHNVGRRRSGMLTRSASKKATPYPKNTAAASPPSKTEVTKTTVDMVRSPLMEKLSQSTASLANGATTKAGGRSRRKSILKKQSSFDGSTSNGNRNTTHSSANHNKTVIFVDDKENAVSSEEDDVYTVDHSTVVVTTSRSLKTQLFSPIVPKVLSRLDPTIKQEEDMAVQEVVVILDDGTYDENDSQAPVLILDDEPYHMNESASATATVGHDESMMTFQDDDDDDDDDDDEEEEDSSQEEVVASSWTNWNLEDMVDTVSPAVGHSPTTTTDNEDHVMGDEDHVVTTSPWYVSTILLALVFFVAPFVMGPSVAAVPAQSFDAMVPAWLAMEQPPVCTEVVPTPEPLLASLKQKTLVAMEQKWNAPPDWLAAEQYAY